MSKPLLTCLSYSGGVQSHGIARMVLAGMIPMPERFAIVEADPGAEHRLTYQFSDWMEAECKKAGVIFIRANGPNLYEDIVNLSSDATRLDLPPFWTPPSKKGKDEGRLPQKCTQHYKIAPIKRAVRRQLFRLFGIPVNRSLGLSPGCVEQWIGFTADEQERVDHQLASAANVKYVRFGFPLHEQGMTKSDVVNVYLENGWPIPPGSMCGFCPWSGLRRLKQIHDEDPALWQKNLNVDNRIKDLRHLGINNPCYVSKTLIPLRELAERGFELDDPVENDLAQCPSGVCFT